MKVDFVLVIGYYYDRVPHVKLQGNADSERNDGRDVKA